MQRKFIFGLIALGFAISMELVLALHLLEGVGEQTGGQASTSRLVSTIDIRPKDGSEARQNTPAPGFEETTVGEEILPDAGYPAAADGEPAPGSEPVDSGMPAQEEYPPPGNDGSGDNASYPPPENDVPPPREEVPPPVDDYPPPAVDTPISQAPTATQQPPTLTPTTPAASPTVKANKTAAASATPKAAATKTAETTNPGQPPDSTTNLVSVPVSTPPELDGAASDPAWAKAPALEIQTAGGANQSATRVTIRSVYDGENVYFLLTWADPSQSFLLNPWEKQKDGSWKRLFGAENKGSDESEYYQDKLALLWPINNSLPNIAGQGCAGACHQGEEKPYGLMYTGGPGQIADLWQLKSVVNNGQVDDEILDDTRYSKDTPWAGFRSDPGKGGYSTNQNKDHDAPAYMAPDGGDRTGAPGYILDGEKGKLNNKLFKPGQRVPSIIKAPFTGDRGDIRAGWQYTNGAWTLELARKRITGSAYDVQFDDLGKGYFFALATFDNAQVRHAVQTGAVEMVFKKR